MDIIPAFFTFFSPQHLKRFIKAGKIAALKDGHQGVGTDSLLTLINIVFIFNDLKQQWDGLWNLKLQLRFYSGPSL
jgi:hypothetical protein